MNIKLRAALDVALWLLAVVASLLLLIALVKTFGGEFVFWMTEAGLVACVCYAFWNLRVSSLEREAARKERAWERT